jgi:hypothetical protein
MNTRAPDPSFLPGGSLPWAVIALVAIVLWAVTCALYDKTRMDLKKARAKAAAIARIKEGVDAAIAVAPFLAPIFGSVVQGIASLAAVFVAPLKGPPPPETVRRHYAGVGSALYEAMVGKLEAPLVAELESIAMKKVEERERKSGGEPKKDDGRRHDGEQAGEGHGKGERAAAHTDDHHRQPESKR